MQQNITISIDTSLASMIVQRALEQTFHGAPLTADLVSTLSAPPLGVYWPGEGGHNAGLVRGENGAPDYYLIVPSGPAAETKAEWGGYERETDGASSHSDGLANTRALLGDSAEHPAAKLAAEFTSDGHTDFYLPARRELQLAEANVPELFSKAWYWSSTQSSAGSAYPMAFEHGWQGYTGKDHERLVRPVRRRFI